MAEPPQSIPPKLSGAQKRRARKAKANDNKGTTPPPTAITDVKNDDLITSSAAAAAAGSITAWTTKFMATLDHLMGHMPATTQALLSRYEVKLIGTVDQTYIHGAKLHGPMVSTPHITLDGVGHIVEESKRTFDHRPMRIRKPDEDPMDRQVCFITNDELHDIAAVQFDQGANKDRLITAQKSRANVILQLDPGYTASVLRTLTPHADVLIFISFEMDTLLDVMNRQGGGLTHLENRGSHTSYVNSNIPIPPLAAPSSSKPLEVKLPPKPQVILKIECECTVVTYTMEREPCNIMNQTVCPGTKTAMDNGHAGIFGRLHPESPNNIISPRTSTHIVLAYVGVLK